MQCLFVEAGATSEILSDFNGIRTHSLLLRKRTLNHFAKMAKWMSVGLRPKKLRLPVPEQSLQLRSISSLRLLANFRILSIIKPIS